MANILNATQAGITIQSDGRDIDEIKSGIISMQEKYGVYKKNCLNIKEKFIWKNSDVLQVINN